MANNNVNINNFGLGEVEQEEDLRDYRVSMIKGYADTATEIKDKLVLNDYQYNILNQGSIGSCVAHAISECKSYIDGVQYDNMYSVGFIYANRKSSDNQGTGLVIREALSNVCDDGDCFHNSFPINEEYPGILNTLARYDENKLRAEASEHKSTSYVRVYQDELKEYFCKYEKPLLISVKVYENFYNANSNGGKIPAIPSGTYRGGHCMLCIGYDGDTLHIVNSWGKEKGDNGIFYLDLNSEIIKYFYGLEDTKNIIRPVKIVYTVGWNKMIVNGTTKWSYSNDGKTLLKSQWIFVGGKWYYIGSDGYCKVGWFQEGNYWYYLDNSTCEMKLGWVKDNGYWYYMNPLSRAESGLPLGAMKTGWLDDNGTWYYLEPVSGNNLGHMYTGMHNIDSKFYEFNSSGALIKTY